jgi:hypothetical protein
VSKYVSDQRDVHATVSEKSASRMSEIMEPDVWETSFDTSCVKRFLYIIDDAKDRGVISCFARSTPSECRNGRFSTKVQQSGSQALCNRHKASVHSLTLVARDPECVALQIHIRPPQAAQFALTATSVDSGDDHRP